MCQLSRLQTLVDDLYSTQADTSHQCDSQSESPTRFWIDTLCVPLHDDVCRTSAICEMRDVYALADRVLVLDSWILKGSTEDPISKRSMRLMMSNWQRRLWTLSEAVLARNLYIQYENASEHTERLFGEFRDYYQNSAEFYNPLRNQSDFGLLCSHRTDEPCKATMALNDRLEYFIISYIPLRRLLDWNGPSQSTALIGSVKDVAEHGRLTKIKFLHKAVLLRLSRLQVEGFEQYWSQRSGGDSDESSEARIMEGTLLDDSQDWCVI